MAVSILADVDIWVTQPRCVAQVSTSNPSPYGPVSLTIGTRAIYLKNVHDSGNDWFASQSMIAIVAGKRKQVRVMSEFLVLSCLH